MAEKLILKPSAQHPITIEPLGRRVVVEVAGQTVAESNNAIVLREASYPPAIYIPREDAQMGLLEHSDHSSYCPFKGDATYFDIPSGGERSKNAVWTYEMPYDAVAQIKGHLAFYPDRVDAIR
ncbi:MAG: DUF427 domain-containing protein [Acidobacteriia bacterium]|nr:DUF427 domain-containing protein [Terriglobia bacterium]